MRRPWWCTWSVPPGEFGNVMATAPTAPMPAEALAGAERLGYAGLLVASGPYMYEHAAEIDLSNPADGQRLGGRRRRR